MLTHKGWRKTTWVKFSASPVASANQFWIEDVSQVVKSNKMHRIKVRENKQKKTTKNSGGKACLCTGVGLSNCRGKRGASTKHYRKWQAYKTKINRKSGKIAERFYIVFQMNKPKSISNFQNYHIKFWDQHNLKNWPRDVFILGKWYFCKEASLVWYL